MTLDNLCICMILSVFWHLKLWNLFKDYILKLDNIEEESNYLFEKLGIEGIKYPKGYGHKSSNSILNEISGEISIRTGKISLKLMSHIR